MSSNVKRWNSLILSLTQEEKEWILDNPQETIAREMLDFDDSIRMRTSNYPEETDIIQMKRLIGKLRVRMEEIENEG